MGVWERVDEAAIAVVVLFGLYIVATAPAVRAGFVRTLRRPATWFAVPATVLALVLGVPYAYTASIRAHTPKPLSFADLAPAPLTKSHSPSTIRPDAPSTTTSPPAARAAAVAGPPRPAGAPGAATTGGPAVSSGTVVAPSSSQAAPATTPAESVAGAWTVGAGSEARYGIDDTVLGQTARVVGRTHDVSGAMQISGTTVTAARVVVDMQTVSCGCVHDAKYHQLLETDKYPTSTFVLADPIALPSLPPPGAVISVPVTGAFTIHGVTRTVTFTLQATRIGTRIAVKGSIPVKLSDYKIQNPNAGSFGGLSNCAIDLLIAFDRTG